MPVGPKISDNTAGKTSKARTYPDLLKNEYDSDLFEHMVTAALVRVDLRTGAHEQIGPPRMYTQVRRRCPEAAAGAFRPVFRSSQTAGTCAHAGSQCVARRGMRAVRLSHREPPPPPACVMLWPPLCVRQVVGICHAMPCVRLLQCRPCPGSMRATHTQPVRAVQVDVSPDGMLMVVGWIERPFSYELPVGRFPRVWQVWDRCCALLRDCCVGHKLASPLRCDFVYCLCSHCSVAHQLASSLRCDFVYRLCSRCVVFQAR